MGKLTHYMWAKALAGLLCLICAFGAVGTLFGLAVCGNMREGELLDSLYQTAADNYAAALVDGYLKTPPGSAQRQQALAAFSDTSLVYAVVESNRQAESDAIAEGEILYGNPDILTAAEFHFLSAGADESGRYEYNTHSILSAIDAGDFIYYGGNSIPQVQELVRDVVYVKDCGLFYVVTENHYFLIPGFSVQRVQQTDDGTVQLDEGVHYHYWENQGKTYYMKDAENRVFRLNLDGAYTIYPDDCDSALFIGADEAILPLEVLQQLMALAGSPEGSLPVEVTDERITGNETTAGGATNTGTAENGTTDSGSAAEDGGAADTAGGLADASDSIWNGQEIHVIETLPEGADVCGNGYSAITGSLIIYYSSDSADTDVFYHVFSYVDRSKNCEDLFWQAGLVSQVIEFISQFGILLEVGFVLFAALFFTFLMNAAGKCKGDNEIHLRIWDKLPFEIYTALAVCIEVFIVMMANVIWEEIRRDLLPVHAVLLEAQLAAVMAWGGIVYCMGFAVRVKSKEFWQYTLIYRLYVWIKRILTELRDAIRQNPSLVKKSLLLLAVMFVAEFILLLPCINEPVLVLFWLIVTFAVKAILFMIAVMQLNELKKGAERIANGDFEHPIDTSRMLWEMKAHGENLNAVGDGISLAVARQMKSEHFKTELITNVSHDIKTPLTSIINYVDLLGKETIASPKAAEYLEVLERQSNRLKKLIEDLMEASKASTGNLTVNLERLEANVFLVQTVGEFEEKMAAAGLELIIKKPEEPVTVLADSRHFWRVIDNLMNNICKYAQPDTRVYIDLEKRGEKVYVTFKNTSKFQLNITGEELMERFVRGDASRNTEGNGLGLSIAKSLMELMKGELELVVDGDLFKVILTFDS